MQQIDVEPARVIETVAGIPWNTFARDIAISVCLLHAVAQVAQEHRISLEVIEADHRTLLVRLSREGLAATLEARKGGESFLATLHEDNPRSASSSNIENLVGWFTEQTKSVENNYEGVHP